MNHIIIAQGCHASVAAIVKGLKEQDDKTKEYTNGLEDMRKVVLKISNDNDLNLLKKSLDENNIKVGIILYNDRSMIKDYGLRIILIFIYHF